MSGLDVVQESRTLLEVQCQQMARRLRVIADELCRDVSAAQAIHTEVPNTVLSRTDATKRAGQLAMKRILVTIHGDDAEAPNLQAESDRRRLCETMLELRRLHGNLETYLS